jgi:hypothetical protein
MSYKRREALAKWKTSLRRDDYIAIAKAIRTSRKIKDPSLEALIAELCVHFKHNPCFNHDRFVNECSPKYGVRSI